MISCREGGYSVGTDLGFWADFFKKDEQIIGFNTIYETNKWEFIDKIMYMLRILEQTIIKY